MTTLKEISICQCPCQFTNGCLISQGHCHFQYVYIYKQKYSQRHIFLLIMLWSFFGGIFHITALSGALFNKADNIGTEWPIIQQLAVSLVLQLFFISVNSILMQTAYIFVFGVSNELRARVLKNKNTFNDCQRFCTFTFSDVLF